MNDRTDAGTSWTVRLPIYYGWVLVVVASLAMTATLPGRTHGLGLITEPLLKDLGIERTLFATINLWSCLLGAFFAVPIGFLIDRWGVRSMLVGVLLALGGSVWWMSGATGPGVLFASLLLIRGLGQSALSVVSMALIGKWFRRRSAVAMGVFAVLLTFGFVGTVLGVGEAVRTEGWRESWFLLAVSLLAFAPIGWLLARDTPESCGLVIDGGAAAPEMVEDSASADAEFTLCQALATPMFWVLAIGASAFNFAWSAVTLFNESILAERGFDQNASVEVMAILTGTGLLANLAAGAVATKERMGKALGVGLVLLAAALGLLPMIATRGQLRCYAAAIGLSGGVVTVVFFAAWGQIFGRSNLVRIQGVAQVCTVLASAMGPVVAADCLARTRSYAGVFYGTAAVAGVSAVLAMFVRLPRIANSAEGEWSRGATLSSLTE